MSDYILVRESRDGRQSSDEEIHAIEKGENKTICKGLKRKELRNVRTLSIFIGESHLCPDCAKKIDGVN